MNKAIVIVFFTGLASIVILIVFVAFLAVFSENYPSPFGSSYPGIFLLGAREILTFLITMAIVGAAMLSEKKIRNEMNDYFMKALNRFMESRFGRFLERI